jgi:hypothetical protein
LRLKITTEVNGYTEVYFAMAAGTSIILAFFIPSFIFVGALWMLVLPMTMINAVKMFARNTKKNMQREHETDRA